MGRAPSGTAPARHVGPGHLPEHHPDAHPGGGGPQARAPRRPFRLGEQPSAEEYLRDSVTVLRRLMPMMAAPAGRHACDLGRLKGAAGA